MSLFPPLPPDLPAVKVSVETQTCGDLLRDLLDEAVAAASSSSEVFVCSHPGCGLRSADLTAVTAHVETDHPRGRKRARVGDAIEVKPDPDWEALPPEVEEFLKVEHDFDDDEDDYEEEFKPKRRRQGAGRRKKVKIECRSAIQPCQLYLSPLG